MKEECLAEYELAELKTACWLVEEDQIPEASPQKSTASTTRVKVVYFRSRVQIQQSVSSSAKRNLRISFRLVNV